MSPSLTIIAHLEMLKEHFEDTEDTYHDELIGRTINHIKLVEQKTSYFQEFKEATIRGDAVESENKRLRRELAALKQKQVDNDWGIK